MSEKTLLEEIKKEQKEMVEKKFALEKERREEKEKEEALKQGKQINIFSSATFPKIQTQTVEEETSEEEQISKIESKVSSVIEKPNYDLMEELSETQREKIFKIEKEEEVKPKLKPSRIKGYVLAILLAIFGVWGVVNIAKMDNLSPQISQIESVYKINLAKYAKNLAALDATSAENMENLLPTIPDQKYDANEIIEQSNWFDRICNFIGGLFGG